MCEIARARLALSAMALAYGIPAWAHGGFGSSKPLLGGAMHLLTSPLSLAAIAGCIAALGGLQGRWLVAASLVVAIGAAIGSAFSTQFQGYAAPAAILVVGLVAVSGVRMSNRVALWIAPPIALLAGLGSGIAAELDEVNTAAVIGVSLSAFVITAYALANYADFNHLPKLQSIGPIARRVIGAWVAAIGLLLFALALRGDVIGG